MNIRLISQNYLPFVGGIETHVRQIAHAYSPQHHVEIVAANFHPYRGNPRLAPLHDSLLAPRFEDYDDEGIPVHALTPTFADRLRMIPIAVRCTPRWQRYAYHGLRRFGYRFYRNAFLPRMRALVRGADAVHCHAGGYLGWLTREVTSEAQIPMVVTPYVHPHQWGDGPDDVAYYQRCEAVIALVETDRDYLVSLGVPSDRVHVIGVSPDVPPSADPEGFRTRHSIGGAPLVLYIGRMMAQKGARAVVDSAARVWQNHPNTRFVFIGPASPAEAAVFVGQDSRIRYLGKVSQQEKADALAACDVFCMPSMSEILPTVYLEAWSYGKPVIGGLAHGLRELVEGNGAGICVGHDPARIADVVSALLADTNRRGAYGEAGRDLVERRYSVAAVSGALLNVYQDVISGRRDHAHEEGR